jgi:hypothetical protein
MGGRGSGMPNASLLRLDGMQIDKEGNITKGNFFEFLNIPLGNYDSLEKSLTPEQALKFRNAVFRMKVGTSAAIPLMCAGPEKCPMAKKCPLNAVGKYPIAEACIVEVTLVNAWTESYIQEFGIDPDSISQMVLVNRLVELDLLDYRANMGLSGINDREAPTLLKTTVIETDTTTTEQVNLHPLLEAKTKFHNERLKLLEALVATPRERYKKASAIGQSEQSDAAKHMSEMAVLVKSMKEQMRKKDQSLTSIKEEAKRLQDENRINGIIETDWEAPDL